MVGKILTALQVIFLHVNDKYSLFLVLTSQKLPVSAAPATSLAAACSAREHLKH